MKFPRILLFLAAVSIVGATGPASATCPGPSCPSGAKGLFNGIGAAAISGQINRKNKAATTRRTASPSSKFSANARRAANRQLQSALNHFGYNVGVVDGALGPRSRQAVASLQKSLDLPQTGTLTAAERRAFVAAYRASTAGRLDTTPASLSGFMTAYAIIEEQNAPRTLAASNPSVVSTAAAPSAAAVPRRPTTAAAFSNGRTDVNRVCAAQIRLSPTTRDAASRVVVDRLCEKRIADMAAGREGLARYAATRQQEIASYCMSLKAVLAQAELSGWMGRPAMQVMQQLPATLDIEAQDLKAYGPISLVCLGRSYEANDDEAVLAAALFAAISGDVSGMETIGLYMSGATGTYQPSPASTDWLRRAYTTLAESDVAPSASQKRVARQVDFVFE